MQLCLVHTADWHNRLTPDRAERLRALKLEHAALLLDCGDAIAAPNIVALPWPEQAITMLNAAGCDAMCLGNREYAWYRRGLLGKTAAAHFPVLATNLLPDPGQDLGHLQRWVILDTPEGVRVGVLGLTQVMIKAQSRLAQVTTGRFMNQVEAAQEAVTALRGEVEVLVALTHYGQAQEAELAAACPELDAILCGHWHVDRPTLELVGTTALARTFHHGRGASILTLTHGVWRQEEYFF